MKKLLALVIALFVVGVAGISAMAQQVGAQGKLNARIHKMGAMGNGLAISQSDTMNFELIKVAFAGVRVGLLDETAEVLVGVLHFGEDKYRLKDVEIGNGSSSANIYDSSGANVGSISLDSYPKGDREVWAGTLTLNEETYNAYVIQAPRVIKPVEKAGKIFDYCKNNPAKCKAVMKAAGSIVCDPEKEGTSCRDKIKSFCEQHPDDNRCKALKLAYCKIHLDDADCRAEIMEKCKANLNEEVCRKLGNIYNKVVQKSPQVISRAPQWFKTIRERIRSGPEPQVNAPQVNAPVTNETDESGE